MTHIIRNAFRLYIRRFSLYLTLLSPVVIPTILLHIIGRYANFGELAPVFTTIFGVILNIVTLFVLLSLITASAAMESLNPVRARIVFRDAFSRSIPFLALFIIVSLITFSVPAFLAIIGQKIENAYSLTFLSIISASWIIAVTLLSLFASYIFVIEKQGPIKSIKGSVTLFLHHPLKTSLLLICILLVTIMISLVVAILTTLIIAVITHQTDILFNPELAESLSPWWKDLIVSIYAYLGLPYLVIATTSLFQNTRAESEELLENHELKTGNRIGNSRPA